MIPSMQKSLRPLADPMRCALCADSEACAALGKADDEGVRSYISFIHNLLAKDGPDPQDYDPIVEGFAQLVERLQGCSSTQLHVCRIREAFGAALGPNTMQGFALHKPHGYPGDFEIIDRIYTNHVSSQPSLRKWDVFFHSQAAAQAVRNRKEYFHHVVHELLDRHHSQKSTILNVASGPARDVLEFFQKCPQADVEIHCVETDIRAIEHARSLCSGFLDRIVFHNVNAFRFKCDAKFDLVWSAGLFDYLPDSLFRRLTRHLLSFVRADGELIIGNFGPANRMQPYMEVLGEWKLHHRDEGSLLALAANCGAPPGCARVGSEHCGVNLFLHLSPGDAAAWHHTERALGTEE